MRASPCVRTAGILALLSLAVANVQAKPSPQDKEPYNEDSENSGEGHETKEEILGKVVDKKKIKSISPVVEIEDLSELSKVDEIMKIDDDLAKKIQEEAEGNGSNINDEEPEEARLADSGMSLETKVQRLLDVLGIDDLDDIIKITPIKSMKKIKSMESVDGGSLTELHHSPKLGHSYRKHSSRKPVSYEDEIGDILDSVGEPEVGQDIIRAPTELSTDELKFLEDDIERINKEARVLNSDIDELERRLLNEKEIIQRLNKMIQQLVDKIHIIEDVKDKHKGKIIKLNNQMHEIEDSLTDTQKRRIDDLTKLSDLATLGRDKELESIREPDLGADEAYDELEREESRMALDSVDKISKIEPLVKVKDMKKIKKMIPLTEEQAMKLKSWQEERNNS